MSIRGLCLLTLVVGILIAPLAAAQDAAAAAKSSGPTMADVLAPAAARAPAVTRGATYMGFVERFNRYYTDPAWKPTKTIFVSPTGIGNGTTRAKPMSVPKAIAAARPGSLIYFLRGKYPACYGFETPNSGNYANPIVLYGERNANLSIGVTINCCSTGRQACFNFEAANYIAVDGFDLVGGNYGVRAVGAGYAAAQHSRGIAVLNSRGHAQNRDPFFSGQSDWDVWERNIAYGAKTGDGHGIYLSNGSDWNIVRFNETFSNTSSDFQINADPASTCLDEGIPFSDVRCYSYAGTGEGRGASDYFLVDSNYFHDSDVGPNFTSVRRSIIRNNIFGPQTRHNVSFWQETDNARLGSSDNKVVHNLFITTNNRHAVQFSSQSTRNQFLNNLLLGVQISGGKAIANPSALLMEVDDTVGANVYRSNLYVSGFLDGRTPNAQETARTTFSPLWFARFPVALNHNPNVFRPTAKAPFLAKGSLSSYAPVDLNGTKRPAKVDLGPIELP